MPNPTPPKTIPPSWRPRALAGIRWDTHTKISPEAIPATVRMLPPDEVRRQCHRGQSQGGDDEAESVDGPVGFDPAAGDDEAADEVADVVQRRDPRTRSGSPTQGRDHQRQCGSVEEPAHPHCHRQAEPAAEGNERVT